MLKSVYLTKELLWKKKSVHHYILFAFFPLFSIPLLSTNDHKLALLGNKA